LETIWQEINFIMTQKNTKQAEPYQEPPPIRWWRRLLRILVALTIIGVSLAGAAYLKNTAPKTQKRPPTKWVPVVQVQSITPTLYQVTVSAMGTVIPARQIVLKSRVAGEVIHIHPEFSEGGILKKGDRIIQLDEADYRLAMAQEKSRLIESEFELRLEQGRQDVARQEWKLLIGDRKTTEIESDLALRKPHLDKVKADVSATQAQLEKATLDLKRTRIKAPFNAIVHSKSVDVGSQVTPQEPLAELVGIDEFWIQASIPIDRLDWLQIPRQSGQIGSAAKIHYAGGHVLQGQVLRLMGNLATEGRMARILIAVKDPLRLKEKSTSAPPLLIDDYVRVEIEGSLLDDVFAIPRTALRDQDTIWLVDDNMALDIRQVFPIWRDANTVVIKDSLKAEDRLVVSDLPAPVQGMEVRLQKTTPPAKAHLKPTAQLYQHTHYG
jgi:RND family efflux transporter MFP subunit